ncbi:MAG: hypothetical protein H0W33_11745 [Gammaproteobacteria bacterium]|nr:hypothetical protein [Gammaproteobacteria bacterium]
MSTRGFWRNERLGLAMIGASLLVICVIIGVMFAQQRDAADARARAQAASLTRLLAAMPYEQLVSQTGGLRALASSQPVTELAYAVITDNVGAGLDQISRPGVSVPPAALPESEAAGLTERTLAAGDSTESRVQMVEYQAPLFADGRAAGYIRVGYFRPAGGLQIGQIPFFASLALAVFLLTPVFYFLVRSVHHGALRVESEPGQGSF